jgi:hypothetical protein
MKPDRLRSIDRTEQIIYLYPCFPALLCDWRLHDCGFGICDDSLYVTGNLQIEARLTMERFPLASAREERREKRLD